MKNVQVIDGADNCTYSIYAFTDKEFSKILTLPLGRAWSSSRTPWSDLGLRHWMRLLKGSGHGRS